MTIPEHRRLSSGWHHLRSGQPLPPDLAVVWTWGRSWDRCGTRGRLGNRGGTWGRLGDGTRCEAGQGTGRDVGQVVGWGGIWGRSGDRGGTWGRSGTVGHGAGNGLKAVAVGLSHLSHLLLCWASLPRGPGGGLTPPLMAPFHQPLEVSQLSCLFVLHHSQLATTHLRPPLLWPRGSPPVPSSHDLLVAMGCSCRPLAQHALPCFCTHATGGWHVLFGEPRPTDRVVHSPCHGHHRSKP